MIKRRHFHHSHWWVLCQLRDNSPATLGLLHERSKLDPDGPVNATVIRLALVRLTREALIQRCPLEPGRPATAFQPTQLGLDSMTVAYNQE